MGEIYTTKHPLDMAVRKICDFYGQHCDRCPLDADRACVSSVYRNSDKIGSRIEECIKTIEGQDAQ